MVRFDGDMASQLIDFRASLVVIPPPPDGFDPSLAQARAERTATLWEGYRRVYFGELECEPTHEQEMNRLRDEIADLEQRAARRARRDGDPIPFFVAHRDGDGGLPPHRVMLPQLDLSKFVASSR